MVKSPKSVYPPQVPRTIMRISLLLLLGALLPGVAADWPQWRGPHRDAHSSETGLLQDFPVAGPKLLWQSTNVGSGFSTPSIKGDRIYLLGNNGLESELALALSTRDGSRVWSTHLGKVGNPKQDPNYPGARSTPTVDGRYVYALGSDGDLVCLARRTGKEKWRKQLRTDFGGKPGEWAYAESVLIDGDKLICTPGGSNATMVALNKSDGAVLWKCATPEGDDAGYASVVIGNFSGVKQYVQFLAKGLVGVDARTGHLLWRYERTAKSPAVVMTPLISDDCIYSGAFRAGGAAIRVVRRDGRFVSEEVYFSNKLPYGMGGIVKVGDYFYGASDTSVMCVEFNTGKIQWQERAPDLACLFANGRFFAHAADGEVRLLEPSPRGYQEHGRFRPAKAPAEGGDAKALAHPVIADGKLYIRKDRSLWCYDIRGSTKAQ
jgi:outer membrane protein assembly factor BamB